MTTCINDIPARGTMDAPPSVHVIRVDLDKSTARTIAAGGLFVLPLILAPVWMPVLSSFGVFPWFVLMGMLLITWMAIYNNVLLPRVLPGLRRRRQRLRAIKRHPDGTRRLPHRIIELALRGESLPIGDLSPLAESKLPALVANLSKRLVIIMDDGNPARKLVPASFAASFEPERLNDSAQLLSQLPLAGDRRACDALAAEVTWKTRLRESVGLRIIVYIVVMLLCPFTVFSFITLPFYEALSINMVCVLLFAVFVAVGHATVASAANWWLVPGGLLFRRQRILRSKCEVGLVTNREACLIIATTYNAIVCTAATARKFVVNGKARQALLSGWLSPARTPTKEEVLAFFGCDAVWTEGAPA